MTDGIRQMTRAQYEAEFGEPVMAPMASPAPVRQMTRAQYQAEFGEPVIAPMGVESAGQPKQNFWEAVGGGAATAANALTFNTGDEIIAGINAPISALRYGQSIGEAYDQGLEQVRGLQQGFRQEQPGAAMMTGLAGAVINPASAIGAPIKGAGLVSNIARAGASGAVQGGLYGFGEGEGGIENRSKDALQSAAVSGVLSGGIAGVTGALAPVVKKAGQAMGRKSFGARASDYKKTSNTINPLKGYDPKVDLDPLEFAESADVETLTKKILNEFDEGNVLGRDRNPEKMLTLGRLKERELGQKIGQVIEGVKTKVTPRFDQTLEFLDKGSVPANEVKKYTKIVNSLANEIKERGKGSLAYLQQQKIAAGDKYRIGKTAGDKFYRTLYHDLQANIEKYAPKVKELNKELQKYKIVNPILERNVIGEEASNVGAFLTQELRTSGGKLTTPVLIASNLGLGALGGPLGFAAGVGLSATTTPTGQMWTSKALRGAANLGQDALTSGAIPSMVAQQTAAPSTPDRPLPELNLIDPYQGLAAGPAELYINQAPEGSQPQPQSAPSFEVDPFQQMAEGTAQTQALNQQPEREVMPQKQPVSYKGQLIDLDVNQLVQSMITQESSGNVKAVSHKGAQGLMQLMPKTGKEIADRLGIEYKPFDPEQNVRLGTIYLNQMLRQFNGDLELALTAYNQGPKRVSDLLVATKGDNLNDIINKLGPDGQAYAKTIIGRLPQIKQSQTQEV